MSREPIPTWFFSLVVARQDDRFLLVHEREHGQRWFFPAGRVEPGETFAQAALRETLEESGVSIELEGVLEIQHTPMVANTARVRAFFLASPLGAAQPRTEPNEHSLEARWVTLHELDDLPLRGVEVRRRLHAVAAGAQVHPLSLLGDES